MQTDTLITTRLSLLPLGVEHAEEMAAALYDPALYTFTGGAPADPNALCDRYVRMAEGSHDPSVTWGNWVIRLREDGTLAGTVQATIGPGPVAAVAWVIGVPWQGRGYAKEAVRALVEWLENRGVTEIVAHIHPEHLASAAVAASAGLVATDEWQDGEVRWRRRAGPVA